MRNSLKQIFVILSFVILGTGNVWGVYGVGFWIQNGEGHGSISPNSWTTYSIGATVTVTATPDAGYVSSLHQCYDDGLNDISVTKNGEVYTFTMPSSNVYFYINFVAKPSRTVTFRVPSCIETPADNVQTTASVFPYPSPRVVDGYKFEGWVSSSVAGTTTKPSTIYAAGADIPSNGTYYALYSSVSGTFDKITGSTSPVNGGNYMLCSSYNSDAKVINNDINDTKHRLQTTEWDMSGSTATCTDWSCIWTFIQGTGDYSTYWFIYNNEKNKYLGVTGTGDESSNDRKMQLRDAQDDYTAWSCYVEGGKITLTNKKRSSDTNKTLKCYGSDAGIYASNTGTVPYFFKQGTLTATYTTNPTCPTVGYTVTYAGGSGATGSVTDGNTYEFGDDVTVLGNTGPGFTKAGYDFVGWTCDYRLKTESSPYEYLIGETIPAGTVFSMPPADITLTAVWEAKTYLYGSSCTPLTNITITYSDNGNTTDVEYGVGTTVPIDSRSGTHGCAEWTFVGWQRGSAVANNSTSYTPVHNFTAAAGDDGVTFYAVYEKVNTDWISALNTGEMKSGATYVIVKRYADSKHYALSTTVASTNYLAGTLLGTDCETVKDASNNNRYKLKVTPTNDLKWEASYVSGYWRLYNKALGKYLNVNSSNYAFTASTYDEFTATTGSNDSDIKLQDSGDSKYLYWYNSGPYWEGYGSAGVFNMCTNSNSFTSTPDCGLRTVTFHGNGGTVIASGGSPTGANLGIQETVRDEPITTPTATFADCNGKSWSFVGWSDKEIDVTRVPVLTTDLLNDGGGNKSHTVTASDEEYWAVFTNQGNPETKYGYIKFTEDDFIGSYTDGTKTKTAGGNSYDFAYTRLGKAAGIGIQFEASTGILQNSTSLGKINYITFKGVNAGSIENLNVYVGDAEGAETVLLTRTNTMYQVVGDTLTYYPQGNYSYFKIKSPSAYMAVAEVHVGFGLPTKVWATTPDCSTITLSGTPRITSTATKTVKGVTTLLVTAKDLASETPLTFTAYNVADDTPNSHFGVVGTLNAGADGTLTDAPIVVTYTPAADATTDGIEEVYFKATALANDGVTTTESNRQSAYGRHLPAKFVIATKVGDKWYGMPNNISSTTAGLRALIPIAVDDATSPTTATVYTSTTDYLVWNLDVANTGTNRFTNMGDKLFFSSPIISNKNLWGDATGLKSGAQAGTGSGYEAFAWTPSTTDLGNYTLLNGSATTYYIGTDGSANWTTSTTAATVRFLAYDEQTPAVITWYNEMLGEQHGNTTTVKTDGTIPSLPSPNPQACATTTLYTTFAGWGAQIATYTTTLPTFAAAGDFVGSSNVTYYATFKHSSNNWWRTSCPPTKTLTYTAGTGTGDDYLVYVEGTTSTSATAAETGFTKDGYTLAGWTTTVDVTAGGSVVTAGNVISTGVALTSISGDLTFTAVWAGNLSLSGNVHLTSYNGVTVFTTTETSNMITVSTPSIAGATGIDLVYLDANGDPIANKEDSPFRLYTTSYNLEDASQVTLAARLAELTLSEGVYSCSYAIGYTPTAYNTTNTGSVKLILKRNTSVLSEATLQVYGRALPQKFVIAANIGGQWKAMPADWETSSSAATSHEPYPISVNTLVAPTQATIAPKEAIYSAANRPTPNSHRGGIRLETTTGDGSDGHLQAARSNSSNKLWRTDSECSTGMQTWYLTSSDFGDYTIGVDPSIKVSSAGTDEGDGDGAAALNRSLRVYDGKITWSNEGATTFRILPVTKEAEKVDLQVVEWKTTGIVFMYFGNPGYKASVEIEGVRKSAEPAVLATSLKVDEGVYEIAVSDLDIATNAYKSLYVVIWNGETEVGRKQVTIPMMVSSTTTVNAARNAAGVSNKSNCAYMDLVVLSGGKLSTGETTEGAQFTFKSVTVYGGGKFIMPADNYFSTKSMYLRAGSVTVTTKGTTPATTYNYVYPQVYLGDGSTLSVNGNVINFDYLTNYDQYFGVTFPYPAAINNTNITYPEDIYGATYAKGGSYLLRAFDSKIRAEKGAVDDVWVDVEVGNTTTGCTSKQTSTVRGLGYYVLLPPRKVSVNGGDAVRQKYGIQRFKMDVSSLSETSDASIAVTAHSASAPYNTGWWMLGNPYMADLGGAGVGDQAAILVGKIGTNAEGQYEWQDKEVRYVTVPNDDASETYDQRPVSGYTFPAFKPFYIQIGTTGTVTFTTTNRVAAAPKLFAYEDKMPAEVATSITLNSEAYGDTTHIIIGKAFSDDYEVGDDLIKMPHANVSLFTISNGTDLFSNALNAQSALNGIPVGFTAPTEGEYIFSYNDKEVSSWIEHLWLTDYDKTVTTDLMERDYVFLSEAETNKTRFVLKVELKSEEQGQTTENGGLIETAPREGPTKFIYQDKLFIRYNGIIYDATGKRVMKVNK